MSVILFNCCLIFNIDLTVFFITIMCLQGGWLRWEQGKKDAFFGQGIETGSRKGLTVEVKEGLPVVRTAQKKEGYGAWWKSGKKKLKLHFKSMFDLMKEKKKKSWCVDLRSNRMYIESSRQHLGGWLRNLEDKARGCCNSLKKLSQPEIGSC